ncbi:MAG: hypothetical protein ACTSWM_01305, partial [Alphaproteobacteria bacterium]
ALTAAETLGCPVTLLSAVGSAGATGPGWFREVIAQARETCPQAQSRAILRCGDCAGHALAALRAGVEEIALDAAAPVRRRVASMARQLGARLVRVPAEPVLDLIDEGAPLAACLNWLQAGLAPGPK